MSYFQKIFLCFIVACLPLLGFTSPGFSKTEQYDLVYIWDTDLDKVLDYKESLEELFERRISKKFAVVGKGKEYGIIYDRNGSARSITVDIVQHGEVLRKAGLDESYAIKDEGYHRLYNVSYGIGPNVDALKKNYHKIYNYLGKGVGKDLVIEQVSESNYSLIYRRRGDRRSTGVVARNHARKLKRKGIFTTIISENNNPVVFGESSLLDEEEPVSNKDQSEAVAKKQPVQPKKQVIVSHIPSTITSIPILKGSSKRKISGNKAVASKPSVKSTRKKTSAIVSRAGSDSGFEAQIETLIKKLRKKGTLAKDEMTGWVVYDLERDRTLVDINANQSFQAASMIKPFVALAFFHQVKVGKLKYGPKSRRKMELMIQRSNNSATNWVMKLAGGPAQVERILKKEYGHIFKRTEIKEYIPSGGRTYKNHALPSDYVRFLRSLWKKELPYGKELRRLMALPGRDRLYHGTPIPTGTLVYNKTGSTAHLCGDMGILAPRLKKGGRYPYVIVGVIERKSRAANYGQWITSRGKVIREVSTLVYKEMKKDHRLL